MKKLILLLVLPLAVFAQVKVDTIIRLGSRVVYPHYIPELNKLYLVTDSHLIALDCSTWQITAEFPFPTASTVDYAWNPAGRKLYVTYHIFDSTLVVYPDADTAHWIPVGFNTGCAYAGSHDLLYGRPVFRDTVHYDELWALDCAADTFVKVIRTPIPDRSFGRISWDSVADRVFVRVGAWGAPPHMAVYDVKTDSLLALFPTTVSPPQLLFHHPLRKAYFVSNAPGVIDTDGLRLIKLFPFRAWGTSGYGPVAVNSLMDKVYFGGHIRGTTCTLFIVDALTDSIIKGVEYQGTYPQNRYVVWVPWSNRVYFRPGPHMAVLDCETDSIIVPELVLPGQTRGAIYLLLDPVRERLFAIGADLNTIHVLRCIPSGVEEERGPVPEPVRTTPTIVRGVLRLPASFIAHRSSLIASDGRQVMELQPGENDVRHLAPGVYFVRAQGSRIQGAKASSAKVVIQR